jgi:hypothetical protein
LDIQQLNSSGHPTSWQLLDVQNLDSELGFPELGFGTQTFVPVGAGLFGDSAE